MFDFISFFLVKIFNLKSKIFTEIVHFPPFFNFWDRFSVRCRDKNRVTYNLFNAEGNSNGIIPSLDHLSNAVLDENHNQAKTFHV